MDAFLEDSSDDESYASVQVLDKSDLSELDYDDDIQEWDIGDDVAELHDIPF
jgi:hypothetical protein